jgi:hypothetical protein
MGYLGHRSTKNPIPAALLTSRAGRAFPDITFQMLGSWEAGDQRLEEPETFLPTAEDGGAIPFRHMSKTHDGIWEMTSIGLVRARNVHS